MYVALLVPDDAPAPLEPAVHSPFEWGKDHFFVSLERQFVRAREEDCSAALAEEHDSLRTRLLQLLRDEAKPSDVRFDEWESDFFRAAANSGACASKLESLVEIREALRGVTSSLSPMWGDAKPARDRLYRLLYGTRMAVEEVLLQVPKDAAPGLTLGRDEPSASPSKVVQGVALRSGDLLVSRGGAPTSAFIARGSDYPGNFSDVALVHIDEETNELSIIEAHIERGVAVSTAEDYLRDKKLRVLVLRLRADLDEMRENPHLPHEAALSALKEVRSRHIPYDFSMNTGDAEKQFCSEVASVNYAKHGIQLWSRQTRFSAEGLGRWMAALGVRHRSTHGPSDLEYDPQLRVVAEWHAVEDLFLDHVHNAVIDALLEQAEKGAEFSYARYLLPVVRGAKAYSMLKNAFSGVGPVPEGMSATVALRAQWLSQKHERAERLVLAEAEAFEEENGYRAPYWKLLEFARRAL